jgi:broad specificity phosphatase PhoE
MFKRTMFVTILAVLLSVPAAAQQTIFLVRHGERADMEKGAAPTMADDPDLSEAGRARAISLATLLKDANIAAIFTTKYRRTVQTAAPLAKATGVSSVIVKATDPNAIVKEIRAQKGNVLVVGHTNTLPDIITSLGVTTPVTIADEEFDNLFIVTSGPTPTLLRLHYR